MKILVIEDDPQIIEAISLAFRIRWAEAELITTPSGKKGVEIVRKNQPDLLILDIGLPDLNGFEVLKSIREFSDIPVLILSVLSEENEKVKGLEWGADDYVIKPFKQRELLARVKALLRRRTNPETDQEAVYRNLTFNPKTYQLKCGGMDVSLTRTEGVIMELLIKNGGEIVSHAQMAESVWGLSYPDATNSLKVYIRRLREKIEPDPHEPRTILTKPGLGYYLSKETEKS